MTMTIEYRGRASRRVMTPADFASYGVVTGATITWDQSNGFEVDVPDYVGIFLLGLGGSDFRSPSATNWMEAFEAFTGGGGGGLHAASHQNGGLDELALDGSQIITGTLPDARLSAAIARITDLTALVGGAPAGGDTLAELHTRLAVIEALGSLATDAELAANLAAILGSATTDADTLGELEALNALRMLKSANLSDVANVVTARTNLGLTIGTDVQAWSQALEDTELGFTALKDGLLTYAVNGVAARPVVDVMWVSGSPGSWQSKPAGTRAIFWSTHDLAATEPNDANITDGDVWESHPDYVPA